MCTFERKTHHAKRTREKIAWRDVYTHICLTGEDRTSQLFLNQVLNTHHRSRVALKRLWHRKVLLYTTHSVRLSMHIKGRQTRLGASVQLVQIPSQALQPHNQGETWTSFATDSVWHRCWSPIPAVRSMDLKYSYLAWEEFLHINKEDGELFPESISVFCITWKVSMNLLHVISTGALALCRAVYLCQVNWRKEKVGTKVL